MGGTQREKRKRGGTFVLSPVGGGGEEDAPPPPAFVVAVIVVLVLDLDLVLDLVLVLVVLVLGYVLIPVAKNDLQLADEATTQKWIDEAIATSGAKGPSDMGKVSRGKRKLIKPVGAGVLWT